MRHLPSHAEKKQHIFDDWWKRKEKEQGTSDLTVEEKEHIFDEWWKQKEEEEASKTGYEDGLYWQHLLACTRVPGHAISAITESELVDFTLDYPRTGYLANEHFIAKSTLNSIYRSTESIPVWVEWVSPYMTEIREFSDVSPSQSQINEAMQIYAATDDKGKGKVADDAWGFEPGWDNSAPNDNVATSSSSSSWAPWSQHDLPLIPLLPLLLQPPLIPLLPLPLQPPLVPLLPLPLPLQSPLGGKRRMVSL